MKNTMQDLNDHLFAQMERLSEEGMSTEKIDEEVSRTSAIVSVAEKITGNASLQLKAASLYAEHGDRVLGHLPQIGKAKA